MDSVNLPEIVEIRFPRAIDYRELKGLCKYLALSVSGGCEVSLNPDRSFKFGDRFRRKPKSIDDVPVRISERRLSGYISRRDLATEDFEVQSEFVEGKRRYAGMNLTGVPGYERGELPSSSFEFVLEIRGTINEYFTPSREGNPEPGYGDSSESNP